MDTAQLIEHFSRQESLPVDVNDVLELLKNNGFDDDIEFIGVEFDVDILQGQIKWAHGHPRPYADPIRYVNIYYHKGHDSDWQRYICCKELLHLLDPESARTTTAADIDLLAEKIGLPPEMQDPLNDGLATNVDRAAEFRAAAVLLPFAARETLLPLYPDRLSIDDIARMADIPRRYAAYVMSPFWPTVHAVLLGKPLNLHKPE
jgi:hypothetical protein